MASYRNVGVLNSPNTNNNNNNQSSFVLNVNIVIHTIILRQNINQQQP